MQYTTNYNLITVEGTDVVNPLVQMNPNFTDIDAAMFANKQATIGSASEIVSGTVHAITRANPDSNYFRYTATGNWTAGDSMSVDGVTVSVYLTDGTTPGTGSYVINSEVFGMISGSRVTLFLASSPVTSLPAAQITFDPTGTNLDPSDTDVDKAIKDIDNLISALQPDTFEVTADGIKTYEQILNGIYALIDATKVTVDTSLKVVSSTITINCNLAALRTGNDYKFSSTMIDGSPLEVYTRSFVCKPSGSQYIAIHGSTVADVSTVAAPAGDKFIIKY